MGLTEVMYKPGSKIVVWTKDITEGIVAQLGTLTSPPLSQTTMGSNIRTLFSCDQNTG